ncbi:MAG: hypothetical protein NTW06_01025 [Candidatus Falkowbacteria bacterium]|nr:hypothetical protein [Candidatus Falkowbacteria bacterium]
MLYLFLIISLVILLPAKALAVCPLCTVVVGACLGISEWLGINDAVTGLWFGGLTVSMIIWTLDWLERKSIKFKFRTETTIFAYYLLMIISLYYQRIIGQPLNQLGACLLDNLMFGLVSGSIAFYAGVVWYEFLKEKNGGKAYFPFQKIVSPLVPLIILTITYYFLTK